MLCYVNNVLVSLRYINLNIQNYFALNTNIFNTNIFNTFLY